MGYATTYRKSLAGTLLALVYVIDLLAAAQVFDNWQKLFIFGAILGITTLLIVSYHQRCLECRNCIEKAGKDIRIFYLLFTLLGIISLLVIFLQTPLESGNKFRTVLTVVYAALLLTATSVAFKAVIGVRQTFDQPDNAANTTYGKAGYS